MKEGWTFLNFEDCIEKCKKTKQLKTSDYLPEGKYPIVSQESDLISGYTNMADYVNDFGKPIVVFGDHSRVVKYIDFAFAVGADGVKILIPTNDFRPKFFYYYLHWHGVENLGYSRHYKLLKEINVPIPTLSEQQHIVEELDLLSSIIEKKKAQIKELDNLAQSLFYEMFGDPISNEKGWQIRLLKEVIKVVGGYAFKSSAFVEEGIPVLRIGNINSGEFKTVNMVFWEKDEKLSRYRMIPGDLVMSLTGTVGKSDYGNVCILDDSYKEYYLNQRNAKLEIVGDIDKWYLSNILKNDSVKTKLTDISRGVRQANISNKDIENLRIPIPPLALQQQFASKIEAIEHQKELIKQSIKEVETLFNSRMDYYFN